VDILLNGETRGYCIHAAFCILGLGAKASAELNKLNLFSIL